MNFLENRFLISLLATLPLGAKVTFGSFRLLIGEMPKQSFGRIITLLRNDSSSSAVIFSVCGGKYEILHCTGNWEDFYSGKDLYNLTFAWKELDAEDYEPKDEMIPPLVEAISRINIHGGGELTCSFRYGIYSNCKMVVRETPGRDEKSITFTLVHQEPAQSEVRRGVSFSISYVGETASVRLHPSGALVKAGTPLQPVFPGIGEQLELALQVRRSF